MSHATTAYQPPESATQIEWLTDWSESLSSARSTRKMVLIDVCKDPCRGCAKLDAETYSDPAVISAVVDRFIPVKLDLFADRAVTRELNVIWTPTILFADRRGVVHYRSLNFLPPADFLDLLDIGEASARQRWGEYDRCVELLRSVQNRRPDGPLTAEAIYLEGISIYLKERADEPMYAVWQALRDRFPDSVWTRRIP